VSDQKERFLKCGSVDVLPNPSYAGESNPIKRPREGQTLIDARHDIYSANKSAIPAPLTMVWVYDVGVLYRGEEGFSQ